ncbi:hypothetical protein CHUV2995_03114 [Corynebacterium diphtheriae subsp. lausannense]|nr:hypothetical protein CHUV2995_03114 [Corynebacterium diphtheriae subsp. lausannense]
MDATRELITSHLQIPADVVAHGDIQAAAEIPFSVLDELAEEVGAEKIPVHALSRVGWYYTKADQIIALASLAADSVIRGALSAAVRWVICLSVSLPTTAFLPAITGSPAPRVRRRGRSRPGRAPCRRHRLPVGRGARNRVVGRRRW